MRYYQDIKRIPFLILFSLILISPVNATPPIYNYTDTVHPIIGAQGMVSSQEAYATKVGLQILKDGGNAIDAAVSVGYALAVTLPRAGNLAGGGFMVIYLAKEKRSVVIDFREKAPLSATRDMFLDKQGNVNSEKARFSTHSVGVPGTVYGLELARKTYGSKTRKELIKPAIRLAKKGFIVSEDLEESLKKAHARFGKDPEAARIFYNGTGQPPKSGERLKQQDLSWTLSQISRSGESSFYNGRISKKIVDFMSTHNGIITAEDLNKYKAVERPPIIGTYNGYTIHTTPPPSSGGLLLVQMLKLLEPFPLNDWGVNSAKTIHTMTEVMKLAYADRAKWLGDTDFVPVPKEALISKDYIQKRRTLISTKHVTPSSKVAPGLLKFDIPEHNDTTHYSVVDKEGNAVSVTYTLNFSYGSQIMVPGTGLILNNEMDDFVAKANVPNAYGLVGSTFNEIAPEKRMLSSMTPTIITKDGLLVMVTGTPGGSRIITTTLQVILNVLTHNMSIAEATYTPRFHHQWLPDTLYIEKGFSPDTLSLLEKKGYPIKVSRAMGSTQSIVFKHGRYYGASDPRKPGALTAAY